MPTQQKKKEKAYIIDQNKENIKRAYYAVHFKTGRYMTEKDRPRKRYKAKDVDDD